MTISETEKEAFKHGIRAYKKLHFLPINDVIAEYLSLNIDSEYAFMHYFNRQFEYLEKEVARRLFSYNLVVQSKNATKHIKTRRYNLYLRALKKYQKFNEFKQKIS